MCQLPQIHSSEHLEGEFETLLKELKPSAGLLEMVSQMFGDWWTLKEASADKDIIQQHLTQIDRKSQQLVDRVIDADSETLITTYETRLREMEDQKTELSEIWSKLVKTG